MAIVVVLTGLLLSLLNRQGEEDASVQKASLAAAPVLADELAVVDADLGLKPMTVPEAERPALPEPKPAPKEVKRMTVDEQAISMPFLWAVDLGELPPLNIRLPDTSSSAQPYEYGTGHPEQGFKIVVIFSSQLDRDTYNRDDREAMHAELAEFAELNGYDLALDVDAVRGSARRPIYYASEKVDRTAAFNNFLEKSLNLTK